MSERIRGSYDDSLYKSTYILLSAACDISKNNKKIIKTKLASVSRLVKAVALKQQIQKFYPQI